MHEKAGFFVNDTMLGKIESDIKRERPNMRWVDSIKEATGVSLQELSWAVRTGHCGHHSFMELPGAGAHSKAWNSHCMENWQPENKFLLRDEFCLASIQLKVLKISCQY